MGLLWLSTVPLTNALVAQIFGVQHVSMLSGVVFFGHQIGSFLRRVARRRDLHAPGQLRWRGGSPSRWDLPAAIPCARHQRLIRRPAPLPRDSNLPRAIPSIEVLKIWRRSPRPRSSSSGATSHAGDDGVFPELQVVLLKTRRRRISQEGPRTALCSSRGYCLSLSLSLSFLSSLLVLFLLVVLLFLRGALSAGLACCCCCCGC